MSNFSFLNSLDFAFNVESNYVYNFYDKNEAIINDNEIQNNFKNPLSYIEININYSSRYDDRISEYSGFYENHLKSTITALNGINLNKSRVSLFNKIHDENENFISIAYDIKREDIEKYHKTINFTPLDTDYEDVFAFLTENKKIDINRNILKKYKDSNSKNYIMLDNVNLSIDKFDTLFRENIDNETSFLSNITIAEKYNPIKIGSMSDFFENAEMFYFKNIGIFVEKFLIDGNKNYIKKDSKFYYVNDRDNQNVKNVLIRDNAVKYGKSYLYVVYPTYVVTLPHKNDYFLTNSFILCDYPHITKELLCKEFKRPTSPSRISFKYFEKEKILEINWSKPLEEQGDVKGYQVFKRSSLDEPYTLIKQIEFFDTENLEYYEKNENISPSIIEKVDFDKNRCEDKDFMLNKIQIYTVCSVDARGYVSNYSMQLAVFYDQINKEIIVDTVSISGAPLHMPNILIPRKTKFFDNDDKIVNNTPFEENVTKFTLYATPETVFLESGESENTSQILKNKYKLNVLNLNTAESYLNDININNI